MDILFVELSDTASDCLSRWWLCKDATVMASGTASLSNVETAALEKVNAPARLATVVLLPDSEILYIQVEVPGRSQARVRQAAPFAVEPHLTENIEDVHIAIGDVQSGGIVPCMVMNKARLESYLAALEQADIRPSVITTPSMLVGTSTELYLIESGSSITLRTSDQLAVVAPEALSSTLPLTIPSETESIAIRCVGPSSMATTVDRTLDPGKFEHVEIESIEFETLLGGVTDPFGLLNLQQGVYAVSDSSNSIRQNLNKTVVVAGICVLLVSAVFLIQGFWAELQAERLREESLDIYETVYNTREVSGNPVFRMQERMGARVDQRSRWLVLLESVVATTAGVEIQNLDFNETQNKMGVSFLANSFQEFETIRSRMEDSGMRVEVNVAEQQTNRVWARITLSTP